VAVSTVETKSYCTNDQLEYHTYGHLTSIFNPNLLSFHALTRERGNIEQGCEKQRDKPDSNIHMGKQLQCVVVAEAAAAAEERKEPHASTSQIVFI